MNHNHIAIQEINKNEVAIDTGVQVVLSTIKCLFPPTKWPWAK